MACPPSGTRVLLIGDSLAVGLDPRLAKHARACSTPYAAVVKGGTGVLHWRPQMAELLATHQPDVVLISLGGNDYWRMEGHPTQGGAAVRQAIPELVEEIRQSGATPLWIRWLIPIPDRPGVDAAWRGTGIAYYDTEPLNLPRPTGDPYHPTGAGFDRLAEGLWPWMAAVLADPAPEPAPGLQPGPSPLPSAARWLGAALAFGTGFWATWALMGKS